MAELPPEVRRITDNLDAVGNTTAAIGKGFAVGSATLAAISLFSAFKEQAGAKVIDIADIRVLAGIFLGAGIPFLFSSMAMGAIGRAAFAMIQEVRRQFRERPGILTDSESPDYNCVRRHQHPLGAAGDDPPWGDRAHFTAPRRVPRRDRDADRPPGGSHLQRPHPGRLHGQLGGRLGQREEDDRVARHERERIEAHRAAVVGDTVGDPFKDTAGPSINILIKTMSVISLVIAPMLRQYWGR